MLIAITCLFLFIILNIVLMVYAHKEDSKRERDIIRRKQRLKQQCDSIKHFDDCPVVGTSVTIKPTKQELINIASGVERPAYQILNYLRYLDNIEPITWWDVHEEPFNEGQFYIEMSRLMYYYHKEGFLDSLEEY